MENIYYSSNIEYMFVKKIQQMLDLQYEPIKKEIVNIILLELDKILKNKEYILNIKDERTNKNIHFIDGTTPLSEVQKKIDNKEFDIAFVLQPMNISNIKDVANNQETMPPKSTYIQPKLRSGLTIYRID